MTYRQYLRRLAMSCPEPVCEHGLPVSDCSPCADAEERHSDEWGVLWAEALDKALGRRVRADDA